MHRVAALALVALASCLPESVQSVTLTPDNSAVEAVLLAADARWEAAGIIPDRVVIASVGASYGAPVRYVPARAPVSVTRVVGKGSAYAGVRWIELADLTVETAVHEMGHALGVNTVLVDYDHVAGPECDAAAVSRPAMCAHVGNTITAADLDLACEAGACVGYSPER